MGFFLYFYPHSPRNQSHQAIMGKFSRITRSKRNLLSNAFFKRRLPLPGDLFQWWLFDGERWAD